MVFDWKKLKKQILDHLAKRFLFILRNEDTFEELGSYKVTLLNIYVLASSIVVFVGILLFLLIILTPFKKYIPGYGDVKNQSEYIVLERKIESLENEVRSQDTYMASIRRMLTGNPESIQEATKDVNIKQEVANPVQKIKEDSMLRIAFETNNNTNNSNQKAILPNRNINIRKEPNFALALNEINFITPLRGTLGAAYKPEKEHYGIDIIAPANSPIKATLAGSIIQSDWSVENGHTIAIQHNNNIVSIYKHNSALLKRFGAHVKAGEVIAIIGNTGTLTEGPHLHFELWYNGSSVNPVNYVRF